MIILFNRWHARVVVSLFACTALIIFLQFLFCLLPCREACQPKQGPGKWRSESPIYVITPTYDRPVQRAELTRLAQTFMLVPNLHWIIVEDSEGHTRAVEKFVSRLVTRYQFKSITLLHAKTPNAYKLKPGEPSWQHPKGVWQRNRALEWIRGSTSVKSASSGNASGVVYFADDDNTYDLELFEEMRDTSKVSVWPVGLAGGLLVERPLVLGNKVVGFNSKWAHKRPYPLDMAGFAISIKLIINKEEAVFSATQKIGYLESHFLSQLISSWDELEPKANRCTRLLVWHTKTQAPNLSEEKKLDKLSSSAMSD